MPEKIFTTLLKRAFYASSGSLISRVSASLAGIIIARAVGPGMFGVYAAVMALIELGGGFTEIGMTTGLKREGSRSPERLSHLLGNAFMVEFLLGLASIGVAFAALPLVSKNPLAVTVFPPLALVILSTISVEPFLAILQIRGEQRLASFLVGGRGLVFLCGITTLALFRFEVVTLAWYHGICYLIASLLIVFSVVLRVSVKLRPAYLLAQLRGALPFGMAGAVWAAFINIPLLFLSHFGLEESVGNFAVAFRFVTIGILMGAIANNEAFLPALFGLFRIDRARFTQVCSWMQRFYIPAGIFVSSALYACSEALVIVIQGQDYRDAIGVLRTLCWSVALTYGMIPADAALTTGDRMRVKLILQVLATCTLLFSSLLLIGKYGPMGASYTRLLGDWTLLALMVSYAYKKKLYPFSGLLGISVPTVITLLAAILFTHSMPSRYFLAPLLFMTSSLIIWSLFLRLRVKKLT